MEQKLDGYFFQDQQGHRGELWFKVGGSSEKRAPNRWNFSVSRFVDVKARWDNNYCPVLRKCPSLGSSGF